MKVEHSYESSYVIEYCITLKRRELLGSKKNLRNKLIILSLELWKITCRKNIKSFLIYISLQNWSFTNIIILGLLRLSKMKAILDHYFEINELGFQALCCGDILIGAHHQKLFEKSCCSILGMDRLTHWGWEKMASIFQKTFSNAFFYANVWISIKISLKFVLNGLINNIPSLVQIMAWCKPGNKSLSDTMMVNLLMHICITPPQWVNFV